MPISSYALVKLFVMWQTSSLNIHNFPATWLTMPGPGRWWQLGGLRCTLPGMSFHSSPGNMAALVLVDTMASGTKSLYYFAHNFTQRHDIDSILFLSQRSQYGLNLIRSNMDSKMNISRRIFQIYSSFCVVFSCFSIQLNCFRRNHRQFAYIL